jgi:hypothetical protein
MSTMPCGRKYRSLISPSRQISKYLASGSQRRGRLSTLQNCAIVSYSTPYRYNP